MRLDRKTALLLALLGSLAGCARPPAAVPAAATGATDLERGRLLYENTCGGCHTTQPHWRDKRIVRSWSDLITQVERWQANARAGWSAAEIGDVAAYLNRRFYHLPCDACGGPRAKKGSGQFS